MRVILKCPVCFGKFKYNVSDGWPDFCQIPECKADINNHRDDDDVVCPNILSFKTKNNDKVARDIMDGSEKRVEMAAAMAGVPTSEMASLKVTDLNDRNDTQFATRDVVNPVTQHMAAMQGAGLPVGFGANDASQRAAMAHTGAEPYAGARARAQLQKALPSVGMAPLPLEISNNPSYRSRV